MTIFFILIFFLASADRDKDDIYFITEAMVSIVFGYDEKYKLLFIAVFQPKNIIQIENIILVVSYVGTLTVKINHLEISGSQTVGHGFWKMGPRGLARKFKIFVFSLLISATFFFAYHD